MTRAEYMAWREDPVAAHRARHGPPFDREASSASVLAIEDQQTVEHYAAALLRRDDVVEQLFGKRGRVRFLKYYRVPERWEIRADAAFFPRDGSSATLLRIRAAEPKHDADGTFLPEAADLFELAYERFTMRQAKVATDRCIVLLLNPRHRSNPEALDLDEMFECHDVTRFVNQPPSKTVASIADVVAEEAVRAADYLQGAEPGDYNVELHDAVPSSIREMLSPSGRVNVGRILGRRANAEAPRAVV